MTAVEQLVEVADVELCVETFGDPATPTLLLVAGAAMSMDWWDDDLCHRLADGGRHVVRYDHRDTGRSTTGKPGAPAYDGGRLALDCVELVDALDVGPVHLVGLSMGGGIAQTLACRRPELVASLTLVATTAAGGGDDPLPGPSPRVRAAFADPPPDPDWGDADAYADWTVASQAAFTGTLPLDEPRVRAVAHRAHARSTDPAAASNHWLVAATDGSEDKPVDARRITAPTLVVHGSDDPLFPLPHGRALAAAVPGATLLVVPGMGHQVPPPETWGLVVPALLRHTAS